MSIDRSDVREDTYRGHGAGGQHRNTTDSAVRLTHLPTGTVVTSEGQRSQWANRQAAWAELERRLRERAESEAVEAVNETRRQQVTSNRAAKTFTHNEQRNEVVDHATGRRWTTRRFARGRW